MDVIALYKVGIKNVIATMGTAVTTDQAHLIKKLSSNVILLFDGDAAGNKATISCSEELLKIGIIPKIVRLEDNLDPDDYLNKYGLDKLKNHLDNPLSLMDYKMIVYKEGKNFHNSDDVANYINEVINELHLVKDNIVKEIVLQRLSKETGVLVQTLLSLINQKENNDKVSVATPKKKENIIQNKYQKAYTNLLFHMLKHEEVIRLVDESGVFIPQSQYRHLAGAIVSFYQKFQNIKEADFIAYLGEKQELIDTLKIIMNSPLQETYTKEEIDDYIKLLNDYLIELEIKKLEDMINTASDEEKIEIASKITNLKIKLKEGVEPNAN